MNAEERRVHILNYLRQASEPVSASVLASEFGVSRQIIVGDIALLRAAGSEIAATPRGYLFDREQPEGKIKRQIVCLHSQEQTEEELNICVDYGCLVQDVIVEHPVYGQLTGELQISSRFDVMQFMEKLRSERVHALYELTDGIHLHTLICPGIEAYEQAAAKLEEAGILFRENEVPEK